MQFYHLDTTLLEISSSLCAATSGKPTAPITTQNLLYVYVQAKVREPENTV